MIPAAIAAQMAITQKNVALSMIKQSANMQKQVVSMIAESAASLSAATRGNTINIAA